MLKQHHYQANLIESVDHPFGILTANMGSIDIPQTQTVALVRSLGGEVEFKTDYPVPSPGRNEVLAKVLYTGVCQSGEYGLQYVLHSILFGCP